MSFAEQYQTPYDNLPDAVHFWRPPERSRATRDVRKWSKATNCGVVVSTSPRREIAFESDLEHKAALVFMARHDVVDVWEQPTAVSYVDAQGRPKTYTFDFRIKLLSGIKLAVEVKPSEQAIRGQLQSKLKFIAPQVKKSFADGLLIVTERRLRRDLVHDAELVHFARRDADPAADIAVGAVVDTLIGGASIASIVSKADAGPAGFKAVVRLIADGKLTPRTQRIDYDTIVHLVSADHREARA